METSTVNYKIDITFGCGRQADGHPIFTSPRQIALDAIKKMAVFFFGSCTISDATIYHDDREDVAKVLTVQSGHILHGEDHDTMNRKIAELGAMIKRKMKQDKIIIGMSLYVSTKA